MTDWDPDAWTRNMIADLRANGGTPSSGPLAGRPLAIMTTKGAKTGQDRTAIVTYHRDGDDVRHRGHEGRRRRAPRLVSQPRRASRGDVRSRQRHLPGRRARNDGRRAPAALRRARPAVPGVRGVPEQDEPSDPGLRAGAARRLICRKQGLTSGISARRPRASPRAGRSRARPASGPPPGFATTTTRGSRRGRRRCRSRRRRRQGAPRARA